MTPRSVLPTEPGTYLFCGFRDGNRTEVRDLPRLRGVEVVRVFINQGKLSYVGSDFFYHPEEAIGSWVLITDLANTIVEDAQATILDHVVRTRIVSAFVSPWGGETHQPREGVISHLCGPFQSQDVRDAANAVFDRAVTLGLIVLETKQGYAGWWKLPGSG